MTAIAAIETFIQLKDGGALRCVSWGDTGGTPVLLFHSLAMTGDFWEPVAAHLVAAGYRVLAPDCRGHGGSSLKAGMTVESAADDAAELLDQLGIASACVAGASMGGSIALAFAARHPARTLALGLVDTTAWYGDNAPRSWAERADKVRAEGFGAMAAFQTTRWFSDAFREANPKVVEDTMAVFMANDVEGYGMACGMLGACDMRPALGSISVPTVVIVGQEDYATPPAMAMAMAEGIAGARLHVLPKLRHLTPLEDPTLVAQRLRDVFDTVGGE